MKLNKQLFISLMMVSLLAGTLSSCGALISGAAVGVNALAKSGKKKKQTKAFNALRFAKKEDTPGRFFIIDKYGEGNKLHRTRVIDLPENFKTKPSFEATIHIIDPKSSTNEVTSNKASFTKFSESVFTTYKENEKRFYHLKVLPDNKVLLSYNASQIPYKMKEIKVGNSTFTEPHAYWSLNVDDKIWSPRYYSTYFTYILVQGQSNALKLGDEGYSESNQALKDKMHQELAAPLEKNAKELISKMDAQIASAVTNFKSKRSEPVWEKKIIKAFDYAYEFAGVKAYKVKFLNPDIKLLKNKYGILVSRYVNCIIFYKTLKGKCFYSLRHVNMDKYSNDNFVIDKDISRYSAYSVMYTPQGEKMKKLFVSWQGNGVSKGHLIPVNCK